MIFHNPSIKTAHGFHRFVPSNVRSGSCPACDNRSPGSWLVLFQCHVGQSPAVLLREVLLLTWRRLRPALRTLALVGTLASQGGAFLGGTRVFPDILILPSITGRWVTTDLLAHPTSRWVQAWQLQGAGDPGHPVHRQGLSEAERRWVLPGARNIWRRSGPSWSGGLGRSDTHLKGSS